MDIAKYIGLFLLKYKYCCLQGLGNLEIKKTPAKHNGTEMVAAVYYTKLNPIGSIDDTFPNFIANNEQVSIAKASNEISEFIRNGKLILNTGGSIIIPSVGAYVMKNNLLTFDLDPAFSLPDTNIVFPVAEQPKPEIAELKNGEEKPYESYTNYNNYNKQRAINWNIIAFWGVIIIIGVSILAWSISYFMKQQNPETVMVSESKPELVMEAPADSMVVDSNAIVNTQASVSGTDTPEYQFVIKEFKNLAQAQKKEKQLISYGYSVSIVNKDSNRFYVVQTMKVAMADTIRVKDSLTKILNPAGVTILR